MTTAGATLLIPRQRGAPNPPRDQGPGNAPARAASCRPAVRATATATARQGSGLKDKEPP